MDRGTWHDLSLLLSLVLVMCLAALPVGARADENGPGPQEKVDHPRIERIATNNSAGAPIVYTPIQKPTPAPHVRWVPSSARANGNASELSETKVREALHAPTTMEFTDTPLQEAVTYLADLHGIKMYLDKSSLEHEGVGVDTPVSRSIKEISLQSALRLLLADAHLTFVVKDGALLITTPAAANRMIELRIYDVGDLAQNEAEMNDLADLLQALLAVTDSYRVGSLPADQQAALMQVVPFHDLLMVRAANPDQEELARVLADLREKVKPGKHQ